MTIRFRVSIATLSLGVAFSLLAGCSSAPSVAPSASPPTPTSASSTAAVVSTVASHGAQTYVPKSLNRATALAPAVHSGARSDQVEQEVMQSQDYWATDGCHYYVVSDKWYSDLCWKPVLDKSGNAVPWQYYVTNAVTGANLYQLNYALQMLVNGQSVPYVAYRDLSNPLFQTLNWAAAPVSGTSTWDNSFVNLNNYVQGTTEWHTLSDWSNMLATGNGGNYGFGPGATGGATVSTPQFSGSDIFNQIEAGLSGVVLRPDCSYDFNNCVVVARS